MSNAALGSAAELSAAIARFTAGAAAQPGRAARPRDPRGGAAGRERQQRADQRQRAKPDDGRRPCDGHAVFNESNPQRDVAVFRLGPRAGRAVVATRIHLAASQQLVAVAQLSDGTFWSSTVDVIVTLAACVEA